MSRTLYPLLFILCSSAALAQTPLIKEVKSGQILAEKPRLNVSKYRVYEINLPQLIAAVRNAPHINGLKAGPAPLITIPHPDGSIHRYQIRENNTMAPALAAKYPQLKAYDAVNIHDATEFAKIEVTPNGFHAMISKAGRSTIFIDPLIANNTQYYMVYYKQDFRAKDTMKCGVEYNAKTFKPLQHMRHLTDFNTCKHRTYRLAMAATAQYTAAAGGTKAAALAAQIVTVNRLNGIYQSELGVDFQLIEDNPDIIYTDPNNQPYTSGDPDKEINENQANIDLVIGSANYDIGHVVDVADSGLASLHSVCTVARKAMGVTGKKDPFGDPFDVDYVAHEFGHQFGANHTQNNRCNRNNDTAVEPGSGSTIMSYAGICAPNVQAHSSAYFHGVSLQEMGEFISDPEHNCPIETPIDPAPIITSLPQTVTIPAQTPFSLTAAAQSDDQSALLYNWEQVDDELSVQPPSPLSVGGPNFRSLPATTSPTRYFPNLAALANNS
ncbi:MAG: reprolysin-like metallopeptidase, partial [Legionella sp.]